MATTIWCVTCGADRQHVAATVDVDGDPMCKACAEYLQVQMERSGHLRLPEKPIQSNAASTLTQCPHGCGNPRHKGLCAAGRKARLAEKPAQPTAYAFPEGRSHGKRRSTKIAPATEEPLQATYENPPQMSELAIEVKAAPLTSEQILAAVQRMEGSYNPQARWTANGFKVVRREELPGVPRRKSAGLNLSVFEAMLAARPEAIEVPVDGWRVGVNLRRRLQAMAAKQGLRVDWSRSKDSTLFYFWLVGEAK